MAINLTVGSDKASLHAGGDEANLSIGGAVIPIRNYNVLTNKPQINGVELVGNKTTDDLGIQVPTKVSELQNDAGYITSAPVASVNGKTGAVTLNASDVGALPNSTTIPSKTSDLVNDSGYVNASQAASAAPVKSVNGRTGEVSGLQEQLTFDATPTEDSANPVTSGGIYATFMQALHTVSGWIDDVQGAIPTKTSDITNDSGFVDSAQAASAAPVQSINGQTGTVTLHASDVGALPDTTVIPTATSDLTNDSGFLTLGTLPIWDGGVI